MTAGYLRYKRTQRDTIIEEKKKKIGCANQEPPEQYCQGRSKNGTSANTGTIYHTIFSSEVS